MILVDVDVIRFDTFLLQFIEEIIEGFGCVSDYVWTSAYSERFHVT